MAKIRILKTINFDGTKQEPGTELTITSERMQTMLNNFKAQEINSQLYIDILEIEVLEQIKKRRSKKS